MSTLLDIVVDCENYLGFTPVTKAGVPLWKARTIEVAKLKKAIAERPSLYTIPNLKLALEYCRRKRLAIKSPIGLLYRIDDALKLANLEKPISGLAAEVAAAIGWEKDRNDEMSLQWIHRLVRCDGPWRADVLEEWKAASRG